MCCVVHILFPICTFIYAGRNDRCNEPRVKLVSSLRSSGMPPMSSSKVNEYRDEQLRAFLYVRNRQIDTDNTLLLHTPLPCATLGEPNPDKTLCQLKQDPNQRNAT
jgi:hypothetical protein